MLEVKINNAENNTGPAAGVDKTVSRILRGMLRTVYGYAKDKPEKVYLYARIKSKASAVIVPIFEINGIKYQLNTLHDAEFIDEKTKEVIDFDFDSERKLSLHKYLGNDLLNEVVPLLSFHQLEVPDELWFSYELKNDLFNIEFSYSHILGKENENEKTFALSVEERISEWLNILDNPEDKYTVNVYDNPELLGEDYMLELF